MHSLKKCFIFINFYKKKDVKMRPKREFMTNTACLDQQIYPSQKSFTQPLVGMIETFRRSVMMMMMMMKMRTKTTIKTTTT